MKIYVSLTSIFQKQNLLLETLKSILAQTVLPDKCFIYLSEEPYLLDTGFKDKKINKDLSDFINSNTIFKIKWCKNIGSYRKLLYLLKEKWNEDCLILTIDDDILYHHLLIENYIQDYQKHRCCIVYRGFTPDFNEKDFSDFHYKKRKKTIVRSLYNFANSGVGTVTHPSFFHKTKDVIFDLKLINEFCKTTDDIWYYLCRIANKIETVLINKSDLFKFQPINHELALFFKFNGRGHDVNTQNCKAVAKKFIELKLI